MTLTRRDISLTVALCASLTLHTLLLRAAADIYIREIGHISLPGFPRVEIQNALLVEPPDDPEHRLGASDAHGESLSASPGETPMQATKGPQNQPFLSLDPAGPGKGGDDPSDSLLPPGQAAAESSAAVSPSPPEPAQDAAPAQAESPAPFGVDDSASDFASPKPVAQAQASAASPQHPAQSASPAMQAAAAEKPAADPSPQGDSESDPIAVAGAAVFHHGSTQVRMGRNHKLTRPHLSLAAQADLLTLPQPIVVLKLKLDETGKVNSATIFRSSGSNNVDEPVKLAAYNWWFEPAKDARGKPVKDVILF